jgi:hypothetical protein
MAFADVDEQPGQGEEPDRREADPESQGLRGRARGQAVTKLG